MKRSEVFLSEARRNRAFRQTHLVNRRRKVGEESIFMQLACLVKQDTSRKRYLNAVSTR